jgi:hypothetical protein
MSPVRRSRYDRVFAAARADLGEEAYAAAWAEGQAMSPDQAIAYALDAPDAVEAGREHC